MNSSSRVIEDAVVDLDREHRCGMPEVVYCDSKSPRQICDIALEIRANHAFAFGTRLSVQKAEALRSILPEIDYDAESRTFLLGEPARKRDGSPVGVVCAGTSDIPVAAEAIRTLTTFGYPTVRIVDVGVAGVHRLLDRAEELQRCSVLIVVAGMEGALPSVVGGLTRIPLIAVPTSVGYGSSFEGLSALLTMLNSCASGISVVNIDNGFGAAAAAIRILKLIEKHADPTVQHPG